MLTIGVDAHKRLHVAVALDDAGREVGNWKGANSVAGWAEFGTWAASIGPARRIGIEGAGNYGRGLAQYLVQQGETVYDVNSRWTAMGRRSARKSDKTDRLDARAVAMFVRQEGDSLPSLSSEDETAPLDLFTTERECAIGEATRLRNQIHAVLLQLDPQYHLHVPSLKSAAGLAAILAYGPSDELPLSKARAGVVRRLAQRLQLALGQVTELAERIRGIAQSHYAPLVQICGINLLTAGAIAGMLGPGQRFASEAALAAYAGVSPREASSAGHIRHRLNRGGNRRLNAVLYRIALTQAHYSPEAKAYLARRVAQGKTKKEAIRALKRFIVRSIWRVWVECHSSPPRPYTSYVQPACCT